MHAAVDRRGREGDPDRTVDGAPGGDGHRDVEQVGAERLRVALARRDPAAERRCDLGPRGERRGDGLRGVGVEHRRAETVDDHDSPARLPLIAAGARRQAARDERRRPCLQVVFGERGEDHRVTLDSRFEGTALGARVGEPQRDHQNREHEDRQGEVAEKELAAHGAGRSRNPTPRTVSIQLGSPSFLRSDATCTSSVFVVPIQCISQTSSRMRRRVKTLPGSAAR